MIKRIALVVVGVLALATLTANQASASNGWICQMLEKNPTQSGVMSVVLEMLHRGYTADNGGPELFAQTVIDQCPDMIPVVQKAADQIA